MTDGLGPDGADHMAETDHRRQDLRDLRLLTQARHLLMRGTPEYAASLLAEEELIARIRSWSGQLRD